MGQAAGQPADALQLLRLLDPRLELVLLGDVPDVDHDALHRRVVEEVPAQPLHAAPGARAVAVADAHRHRAARGAGEEPGQGLGHRRRVVGVEEVELAGGSARAPPPADHPRASVVPALQNWMRVSRSSSRIMSLDFSMRARKRCLGAAQRPLRLDPGGDVARDADDLAGAAGGSRRTSARISTCFTEPSRQGWS